MPRPAALAVLTATLFVAPAAWGQEAPPPAEATPATRWQAPAPLGDGEVYVAPPPAPRPPRIVEPLPDDERRDFVTGRRVACPDPQRPQRILAESTAALTVVSASFLVGAFATQSDSAGEVLAGLLGAAALYVVGTPVAVHLVGSSMGGSGRLWASLLGGILPVVGHVGAYELSFEASCDAEPPRGRPAPERNVDDAPPPARATQALVPVVTPGAMGVAVTF